MSGDESWLPGLWRMADAGNDWTHYIEQTYSRFRRDFIESQPQFRGVFVRCRRDPIDEDGKEVGFWHCVTEGPEEELRIPDLRRCERIAWIRPIIEHSTEVGIDVWENRNRGETRILLWYCEEFLIVLAARERRRDGFRYYQLITAYLTVEEHRKRKLRRERDEHQTRNG
ncbi:hypothetical protein [Aquisphaera insulae]|uniref:hypothetical protein n=1 Tax=Aquisphaera insulae TaxID=2712864 RepID=UPI0013EA4AFF|nr:hypothetical protein [Aquisphaera insulae]